MLESGVQLAGVNIMTMNFGPLNAGQTMLGAAISAADATHRQLAGIYERAELRVDPSMLWSKIGLTPMVGKNDVSGQVLSLRDAEGLNRFALDRGIGRVSMWSLSRDKACSSSGKGQPGPGASPHCSGVNQENGMFARLLGNGYAR
jgi:chitinase